MWWVIPVAIGGAALIYNWLSQEASDTRKRFESRYDDLVRDLEWHNENLRHHVEQAQYSADFHLLTNVHFSSFKVADATYDALRDARKSQASVQEAIDQARSKKRDLNSELRKKPTSERRQEILNELHEFDRFISILIGDIKDISEKVFNLKTEIEQLNTRTRELKLAIRDRCGLRGREWYERLEARSAAKRRQ